MLLTFIGIVLNTLALLFAAAGGMKAQEHGGRAGSGASVAFLIALILAVAAVIVLRSA